MLIRHNERSNATPAEHWAHDTTQTDLFGCTVSGSSARQWTTQDAPCTQCAGYGQLVRIERLSRTEYPKGALVPERYLVRPGSPVPAPEPAPAPAPAEPAPEPVPAPPAPSVQAAPTDAAQAISDLLSSLVPDAASVRAEIASATADLRAQCLEDSVGAMHAAIAALLVPITVKVERYDGSAHTVEGTVHAAFTECLQWLSARCHLWLVGPAGCGKTTLAAQVAEALGVPFYSTGMVLAEHQVMGFVDANGNYHTTPFRQAFEHGGLHLSDEMDSWSPEASLAMNAALANGHATFPDSPQQVKAHEDFYVIAAANTYGSGADRQYVGRNEMDAATLDRFVMVPMDYDKALEASIAGEHTDWLNLVWKVRSNIADHKIREITSTRAIVKGIALQAVGGSADLAATRLLRKTFSQTDWEKVTA